MITFGYKNKFSSILRALAAIAIGLIMVITNDATIHVVKIIAALLFATGLVSAVYGFIQKQKQSRPLLLFNAIVDMLIGLILFIWPSFIGQFIVYIIGGILILFGILQLIVLISTSTLMGAGIFSLILSGLALAGGIILIFNPFSMEIMSIIAGVSLIVYGTTELISMWRIRKATEYYEVHIENNENINNEDSSNFQQPDFADTIKDVEYEKISDKTIDDHDIDEQ